MKLELPKQLAKYFQQATKKALSHIPDDPALWPAEWKTIYYKEYPRFKQLKLPRADSEIALSLVQAITSRESRRDFNNKPLTIGEVSSLLYYSCGRIKQSVVGEDSRAQPSGGARFPLEMYLCVIHGNNELKEGFYHYNVKEHTLELLLEERLTKGEFQYLSGYQWVQNASALFLLSGVFARTEMKYHERGFRFALIEAGHVGQNLYLVSEAMKLKCCALGGVSEENFEALLHIDGTLESLVYALAVGK